MDMANSAGCQGHMQAPGQGHNLANGTSATTVLSYCAYGTVLYCTVLGFPQGDASTRLLNCVNDTTTFEHFGGQKKQI